MRHVSVWRQTRAIVLLPGVVTVLVPLLILIGTDWDLGWGLGVAASSLGILIGLALVVAGFALWLWTVRLFAQRGRGTLAPWDPPKSLVVEGPYCYVRNPMIAAVLAALAGEALLFGSPALLAWFAAFFTVNYAFFALHEEPSLERRFGDEYRTYKRNVPRWLPRRTPWMPPLRG